VTGRDRDVRDGTGGTSARALLATVRDRLVDRAAAATDPRVTVGDRVVLVDCEHPGHGRLAGVAHRPAGSPPATGWPSTAAGLAALAVEGDGDPEPDDRLAHAVGIATLNALSAPDVDWLSGDPMAALSATVDVVATVGLFRPAFRKFDDVEVRVVERDPPAPADVDAPAGVQVATFEPAAAERAFAGADVLFLTGSTLVYGGVDRYLAAADAAGAGLTVLIGATASFLPEPAFDAGVDLLAGARVADLAAVRERVAAGDCDTDLHDHGLEKGYVVAPAVVEASRGGRGRLPGLTLPAEVGANDGGPTNETRIGTSDDSADRDHATGDGRGSEETT
jgi:hypothetical protein